MIFAVALFVFALVLPDAHSEYFQRVATYPACELASFFCAIDTTVARSVTTSSDGNTLIYTDSELLKVGFVDISNPDNPKPSEIIELDGIPKYVVQARNLALVTVVVEDSPSLLVVIDIEEARVITKITLSGVANHIAVSPDDNYVALTFEKSSNDNPPNFIAVIDLTDRIWTPFEIEISDLDGIRFPSDPEPKQLSINEDNVVAVSLQKNNGVVLIDLRRRKVITTIDAGLVTLDNVDVTIDRVISQSESSFNLLREPNGIAWIDDRYFVTADEGILDGGSRGFTIFDSINEEIAYTSGSLIDHLTASIGHYPEQLSNGNSGEPESVSFGKFDRQNLIFLSIKNSGVITVFDVSEPTDPDLIQVLPAGLSVGKVFPIPQRNLLVVGTKMDFPSARSSVTIYEGGFLRNKYPTIISNDRDKSDTPIPWGALSGLAGETRPENDPFGAPNLIRKYQNSRGKGNRDPRPIVLYAVEDSFYRKSRIFTINAAKSPARLVAETRIKDRYNLLKNADMAFQSKLVNQDNTVNLDLEGIAIIPDETTLWVVSEGKGNKNDDSFHSINYLIKVDDEGDIIKVVTLPDSVNNNQRDGGFAGVAVGDDVFSDKVVVAFKEAWNDESAPRLGVYDMLEDTWEFYFYPLDPSESPLGGRVVIADIAPLGDDAEFLVLERDDQAGPAAAVKRIYKIDLADHSPNDTIEKTLVRDIISDLRAEGGLIVEKVEGMAVDNTGDVWIVNDNDGVHLTNGETLLLNVETI